MVYKPKDSLGRRMYTSETRGTELKCVLKSPRRWLLGEALALEVERRGASEVYANESVSRVDLAIGIALVQLALVALDASPRKRGLGLETVAVNRRHLRCSSAGNYCRCSAVASCIFTRDDWWDVAHPAFLQQTQVEQASPRLRPTAATTFGISFQRDWCARASAMLSSFRRIITEFLEASRNVDRLRLPRNFRICK